MSIITLSVTQVKDSEAGFLSRLSGLRDSVSGLRDSVSQSLSQSLFGADGSDWRDTLDFSPPGSATVGFPSVRVSYTQLGSVPSESEPQSEFDIHDSTQVESDEDEGGIAMTDSTGHNVNSDIVDLLKGSMADPGDMMMSGVVKPKEIEHENLPSLSSGSAVYSVSTFELLSRELNSLALDPMNFPTMHN